MGLIIITGMMTHFSGIGPITLSFFAISQKNKFTITEYRNLAEDIFGSNIQTRSTNSVQFNCPLIGFFSGIKIGIGLIIVQVGWGISNQKGNLQVVSRPTQGLPRFLL